MEYSKADTEGIALLILGFLLTALMGLGMLVSGGGWVLTLIFDISWFEGALYTLIAYILFEAAIVGTLIQGSL